jgi:hypothetical protein
MNATKLKGKTVAKVHQQKFMSNTGPEWVIDAVEFIDGSFLRFMVTFSDNDMGIKGIYCPARHVSPEPQRDRDQRTDRDA